MKTFTIAQQGGIAPFQIEVPTQWADVTLQQYIQLVTDTETHPLCVLTALTPEQLDNLHYADAMMLTNRLDFLKDTAELESAEPSEGLPEIGKSSYGQLLLATQHVQSNEGKPLLASAPYLFALYRSQQIEGKYNEKKLDAMLASVLAAPVISSYADMLFTVAAWQNFTNATLPTMNMTWTDIPTMKSTPAWRKWLTSLGFLQPLTS